MRRHLLLRCTLVLAGALASPAGARHASAQALDDAARAAIVEGLIAELDRAYVFPDVATRMAADLRARLGRGEYGSIAEAPAFATLLTDHLQAISRDKHLRVRPAPERAGQAGGAGGLRPTTPFGRTERMAGDIAYIEIVTFGMRPDAVRDAVRDVMDAAADARAMVIDLRRNGGGSPELVALISSYLFDGEPVHLNSLYWRPTDTTEDFYTDPDVEGRRFGGAKPVYVLTSGRTFSAAEEFTYNLQTRRRATIVGDTTGGGAHPGGQVRLPHGLSVFVPSGRAINPITGGNWEGTGVVPDVRVEADAALEAALKLAGTGV